MKNFIKHIIISVFMVILSAFSSQAAPLSLPIHHTPLLEPDSFATEFDIKTAALYWLPDYQGKLTGRTENSSGGDTDKIGRCGTYGMVEACGSPKVSTGTVKPVVGLVCQKSCVCPTSYQYTSANCSGNKQPEGSVCDGKYNGCTCKPEFKYNASNCSGDYKLSGTSCEGKYNSCVGKTCAEGGYYDKVQPDRKCSNVTYGGKVCQSCYQPQCSEGGYEASSKTGYICTAKAYYGRTCYSCTVDPCYNLTDKAPCTYGCQTSYSQCKSKCQACKTNPDCDVVPLSCTYGCAGTNSCGICTSCKANTCAGYDMTSCPSTMSCDSCSIGSTIKYKFKGCYQGCYYSSGTCKTCNDGYFSEGGTTSSCYLTPAGTSTYLSGGCQSQLSCQPGYYCPAGTVYDGDKYCPDGKWSNYRAGSVNDCFDCPVNKYCRRGTIDSCYDGSYCPAGSSSQNYCPDGTWSNLPAYSASDCYTCPAGTWCRKLDKGYCWTGYYCPAGSGYPRSCEPGYYCPPVPGAAGLTAPIRCPAGKTTKRYNATSIDECV